MNSEIDVEHFVLIVDDNEIIRESLSVLLTQQSILNRAFSNANDAKEWLYAQHNQVGACLLDAKLGGNKMSGLDLLRHMTDFYPHIPVLFYSGQDESVGWEAINAGASLYVQKPFDQASLITMVRALDRTTRISKQFAVTRANQEVLQQCLDGMNIEVAILDRNFSLLMCNRRKQDRLKRASEDVRGLHCRIANCQIVETAKCAACQFDGKGHPIAKPFGEFTVDGRTMLLQTVEVHDDDGSFKYYVQTATDITRDRKAMELVNHLQHWALQDSEQELAQKFADNLTTDMDLPRVRIYHFDPTKLQFRGVVSKGLRNGDEFVGYPLDGEDEHSQLAFLEGRPILLSADDVKNNQDCFRFFEKEGVRYQVQVPCSSFGERIALISADDKGRETSLEVDDRNLLGLIAPAYADAIATIRKREEDNRRIQWYRLLAGVDRSIAEGSNVPSILGNLAEGLKDILQASGGLVFLRSEIYGQFVVRAASESCKNFLGFRHEGIMGKIGDCVLGREVLPCNTVQADPEYLKCVEFAKSTGQLNAIPILEKIQSMLLVPVSVRDHVVGVVGVYFVDRDKLSLSKVDDEFVQDMVRRVAITVTKLDESRRVEVAMRQSAKLADLALLTTGVAHSIRNPLETMRASIFVAKKQLERLTLGDVSSEVSIPKVVLDAFGEIEAESSRALDVVSRLLRWAGPQGTSKKPVDICCELAELIELVRPSIEQGRGIQLSAKLDSTAPLVFIGPEAIRVALIDLFWNAAKAIEEPAGGKIEIEVNSNASMVTILIRDNGKGMEQETVDQYNRFDPLRPLPPGGIGLGMYLARKAVESGNGGMSIESKLGHGTTITISLPLYTIRPYA